MASTGFVRIGDHRGARFRSRAPRSDRGRRRLRCPGRNRDSILVDPLGRRRRPDDSRPAQVVRSQQQARSKAPRKLRALHLVSGEIDILRPAAYRARENLDTVPFYFSFISSVAPCNGLIMGRPLRFDDVQNSTSGEGRSPTRICGVAGHSLTNGPLAVPTEISVADLVILPLRGGAR